MARQYSPKAFFWHVPNAMLKRYFDERGVLREHDFSELTKSNVEPIYQAWLTIPDDKRGNNALSACKLSPCTIKLPLSPQDNAGTGSKSRNGTSW